MASQCLSAHWWVSPAPGDVALVCGQCGHRIDLGDVDRGKAVNSVALHNGERAAQRFREKFDLALDAL